VSYSACQQHYAGVVVLQSSVVAGLLHDKECQETFWKGEVVKLVGSHHNPC
jgi:hypothetical protein